ncbi:uncharacterized protein LOC128036193 [Gossypium raimondii]|uniref:uncharacterized protein LOC128036193 n=1 Tax=Gossypium raimondii TaxID=29730 RepID=UPI00227CB4DD|nr:uncharacterized protein LOC128036193 [Gossypium raimondii]
MNVLRVSDAAKCKAFSTTLKGSAKDWFRAHRAIMNTPMGLMSVKQGECESLQDYVKRFHAATLNMKNLEDQSAIDAFIMGVKNDHVQYSFTDNKPQSLADLYK